LELSDERNFMQTLKTSTLIRKGLAYLWDGTKTSDVLQERKEEFLCHAIFRAARGGMYEWMLPDNHAETIVEVKVQEIRKMIEKRLFPWNNLSAWLLHAGGVPEADLTDWRLQKHRKQWANRLIAEFKLKGD
jgi:hypothetical protein